jgi:hypothetical protein
MNPKFRIVTEERFEGYRISTLYACSILLEDFG